MSSSDTSPRDAGGGYSDVAYLQFNKSRTFVVVERTMGILTWPIVIPAALLSRLSDIVFRTFSEVLSVVPYVFGIIARYEFYRFALSRFGRNVQIEFGAVFIHRDISIGDDVLIGRYSIVHDCNIGNHVLVGERCTLLSGSRQHTYARTDIPMAHQGGQKKTIAVEDDCWIGSHAVVMDSIRSGSIVAAAAVVTKEVAERSIVAGNPARLVGTRAGETV